MKKVKDRLAALVPYYDCQGGNATQIYTTDGEVIPDRRTVKWNLRRLARLYSVDLQAIRSNYGSYLGCRQGVPLALSADLVLIPLKTRTPVGINDGCYGYLNGVAIEKAGPASDSPGRCALTLAGGHRLVCHYSCRTVHDKIRLGQIARDYYRRERPSQPLPDPRLALLLSPAWWGFLESLVKAMVGEAAGPNGDKK